MRLPLRRACALRALFNPQPGRHSAALATLLLLSSMLGIASVQGAALTEAVEMIGATAQDSVDLAATFVLQLLADTQGKVEGLVGVLVAIAGQLPARVQETLALAISVISNVAFAIKAVVDMETSVLLQAGGLVVAFVNNTFLLKGAVETMLFTIASAAVVAAANAVGTVNLTLNLTGAVEALLNSVITVPNMTAILNATFVAMAEVRARLNGTAFVQSMGALTLGLAGYAAVSAIALLLAISATAVLALVALGDFLVHAAAATVGDVDLQHFSAVVTAMTTLGAALALVAVAFASLALAGVTRLAVVLDSVAEANVSVNATTTFVHMVADAFAAIVAALVAEIVTKQKLITDFLLDVVSDPDGFVGDLTASVESTVTFVFDVIGFLVNFVNSITQFVGQLGGFIGAFIQSVVDFLLNLLSSLGIPLLTPPEDLEPEAPSP